MARMRNELKQMTRDDPENSVGDQTLWDGGWQAMWFDLCSPDMGRFVTEK